MIPSDHFVRFYNETFKFMENHSEKALRDFWLTISEHMSAPIIEFFREKGFYGMKDYYDKIIFEENLKAECFADDDHFELKIYECASLRKAKDNDAGLMHRYCDHCHGWINPFMKKLGYYLVFDIESRTEAHCKFYVFKDSEKAKEKAGESRLLIV